MAALALPLLASALLPTATASLTIIAGLTVGAAVTAVSSFVGPALDDAAPVHLEILPDVDRNMRHPPR